MFFIIEKFLKKISNQAEQKFRDQNILVQGEQGVGKTVRA